MACDDWTPFTVSDYPHTINRLRVSSGDETNQSTGEWSPAVTGSMAVKGYLGIGDLKIRMNIEKLGWTTGGLFQEGDLYFACHDDCDVSANDILEVYDDAGGSSKSYWRVIAKNKELYEVDKLTPFGRVYFLVRREER